MGKKIKSWKNNGSNILLYSYVVIVLGMFFVFNILTMMKIEPLLQTSITYIISIFALWGMYVAGSRVLLFSESCAITSYYQDGGFHSQNKMLNRIIELRNDEILYLQAKIKLLKSKKR